MRAVRICASGTGKNRTALLQKRTPRVLQLQAILSLNWSYDKILIDLVRSGLTVWSWRTDLAARGPSAMTESQIFFHPALPLSQ